MNLNCPTSPSQPKAQILSLKKEPIAPLFYKDFANINYQRNVIIGGRSQRLQEKVIQV